MELPLVGDPAIVSTAAGYPGSRAALSGTVAAAFRPLMLLLVSAAVAVLPMGSA